MTRGAWVLVLTALVLGCSSSPPKSSVTGKVTLNGKPVTAGQISFIPPDGHSYQAEIQPDGSYRVDEVFPGECVVLIYPPPVNEPEKHMRIKELQGKEEPKAPAKAPAFPPKYSELTQTDLRFTVNPGENSYNPELKR